jgi:hypothetical protein
MMGGINEVAVTAVSSQWNKTCLWRRLSASLSLPIPIGMKPDLICFLQELVHAIGFFGLVDSPE